MRPLQFLNLPSGAFMLGWHGPLSFPNLDNRSSQPNIDLAFFPVNSTGHLSGDRPIKRSAPVGYLGMLHLGTVWEGNLPAYRAMGETISLSIDITDQTTKIIKAGLPDESKDASSEVIYNLPFDVHPFHIGHTDSYCCSVALDGCSRLIVPCAELLRFYFGSSATLLTKLLSVPCDMKQLYESARVDSQSGTANLKLAPGVPGASAEDVSRIAFVPEAKRSIYGLWKALAAQSANGCSPYIRMGFPFSGKTTLLVRGVWLSFAEIENYRFVVQEILSCTHSFPYQRLFYSAQRAGDGKKSEGAEEKNKQSFCRRKNTENAEHVDREPRKHSLVSKLKLQTSRKFPDLANKPVCASPDSGSGAKNVSAMQRSEQREVSVGEGGRPDGPSGLDPVTDTENKNGASGKLKAWLSDNLNTIIKDELKWPVFGLSKVEDQTGDTHFGIYVKNIYLTISVPTQEANLVVFKSKILSHTYFLPFLVKDRLESRTREIAGLEENVYKNRFYIEFGNVRKAMSDQIRIAREAAR